MPRTYKPTGRPRGRPKGSRNKPKTLAQFIQRAVEGTLIPEVKVKPPRRNRKPGDPPVDPKISEVKRKAAAARTPESFKNVGRKKGVPYHSHSAKHQAIKKALRPEITRMVKIMKKNKELPEDLHVKSAVSALLEIVAGDEKASDRVSAARTILDHFHAKPTQKQEITVNPLDRLQRIAEVAGIQDDDEDYEEDASEEDDSDEPHPFDGC